MVLRVAAREFEDITPEMKAAFDADGVIVFENLLSSESCRAIMARMTEIIDGFDPDARPDAHPDAHWAMFKSGGAEQIWERDLIESARDVRFFFEDEALAADGSLKTGVREGLNKVGHALHDKDDVYSAFSRQLCFQKIAEGLGLAEPRLLQSMHIFKPPRIGGEVVCHQDSTYLWTEPQSCLGIWVALEDATLENGCLWGIPGAHREAHPRMRWRQPKDSMANGADSIGVAMEILDDRDWPEEDCVPLEATCGTVIVFDGQFPHRSSANRSDRSREAYTLHLIDGICAYPDDNWLQWPADDPIRGFD